jgi:hypothetical protein
VNLEQLEAEALKLPVGVRAHLAERLISSLDEDSEIEEAWEVEAESRYQQYLAGEMGTIPAADALEQIRAELSR